MNDMKLNKVVKKLIIYGNGSMARVLYSYVKDSYDVAGFCVDDFCIDSDQSFFCGLPLVNFTAVHKIFPPVNHNMIISVGFIEMNEIRERKYKEIKDKGYKFFKYIHPSVHIPDDVEIGENCIILDFVVIHSGSKIGHSTFITGNVNIGHDCIIEPYNWINGGVSFAGNCHVGSGCFFGVNACVSNDVSIGKSNYIGANTLISKNTNDSEVYISPQGEQFRLSSKKFLKFIGA